jgi:hypothetical protein
MIKVDLFSIITGAHFAIASVINTLRVPSPVRHIQVQCDLPQYATRSRADKKTRRMLQRKNVAPGPSRRVCDLADFRFWQKQTWQQDCIGSE